jgi:ABC-type transporter Mla subunit MlaD
MKLDEARQELQRVRAASERVSANLVELEIDSSRQLLEARKLTGESATRWSAASAALTKLWEWRGLLDGFLGHAEELSRGGRRMRELEPLLVTPSIELARSPVPLAERELLGSSEVTVRCTPDQLLERMSAAFDGVKTVVAEFGRAWDTLTPRLAAARGLLDQVQAIAASSGESGRTDLDEASDRLTRLGAALTSDPLSVAPSAVDRVIDSLEAIRRDLEATGALRRDFDARLADSRALLRQLQSIVDEAHAAHEELLIKIAAPAAGTPPELPADLDENRAPIESRNQLRSLLEAYQVKASRLGTVEDPELERTFAQAHQALYTAPTDLALVAQLVRRYQERLSAAQPAREAIR